MCLPDRKQQLEYLFVLLHKLIREDELEGLSDFVVNRQVAPVVRTIVVVVSSHLPTNHVDSIGGVAGVLQKTHIGSTHIEIQQITHLESNGQPAVRTITVVNHDLENASLITVAVGVIYF